MDVQSHPHHPLPPPPPPLPPASSSQPTDLTSVEKFDAMSFASRMSSFDQTCSCCPYGYHIDLDFLRYLDSLHNSSDTLKKLKKIRYGKGGGSLPRSVKPPQQQAPYATQTSPRCSPTTTMENKVTSQVASTSPKFSSTIAENLVTSQLTSAASTKCSSTATVENIVTCSTSRRSGKEVLVELDITPTQDGATTILSSPESSTKTNPVSPDSKFRTEAELFISDSSSIESRESSIHVVDERHETSSRSVHAESFSRRPLELPVPDRPVHPTFPPHPEESTPAIPYRPFSRGSSSSPVESEASGISPAVLQAIREQMALSLRRMKELEEQVKVIPALHARISVLVRENEHLAQSVRSSSELSTRGARVGQGLLDAWTQSDEESFQSEFRMIRDNVMGRRDNATRERRDFDVNCNRVAEEDDVVAVVNVVGVSSMVGENRAKEGRFYSVAIQCQLLTDGVRSEGGIKEEMTSVAVDVRPSVISRCVGTDDGFLWYPADNTTHDISMGNPSISTLGNPEQRLAWWMKLGVDKSTSVDETLWNGVEFQTNEVHDAREVEVLEERQNIVSRTERVQLASPQSLTAVVLGEPFAVQGQAGQQRDVGFTRRLDDVDSGEDSTEEFEFSDRSFEFETAASLSQSDDSRKPWPVKSEGVGNVGEDVVVEKAVGGGCDIKLTLERKMEPAEERDVSLKTENFVVTADGVWLEKKSEVGGKKESLTSKLISETRKEAEIQDEEISNADKETDDKSEEIYAANKVETNDEEILHAGKEAENKNAEILGVDETTKHEERDIVDANAALKNKDEGEALGEEEIVEITPENEDKPSIEAASNEDQSKTEFFLVVDQIVRTPMLESKRGTMSQETNLEVLIENEVENQEDQEISAEMSLENVEKKQDDQENSVANVDLVNSEMACDVINTQATSVSASKETVIFNQKVENEDKDISEVLNEGKYISEVGNESVDQSEVGYEDKDVSEVGYEGKDISETGNENKGVSEVGNEDGGISDTGKEIEVTNEPILDAGKETEKENEELTAAGEEARNEEADVVALEVAVKNNDGGVLVETQKAEIKVGEIENRSSAYNEEIEPEDKKSLNEQTEPKETEEVLREDKFPNEDTLDMIRKSEKVGGEEISESDSDLTRTDEESGGSYEIDWTTRGDYKVMDEEAGVTIATKQEITRPSMIERNELAVVVEAHEGTSSPKSDLDDEEIMKSLSQAAVVAIDTRGVTMETEVTVDHGKEVARNTEEGESEAEVSEEKILDVIVCEGKESEVKLYKEEISEVRVPEENESEAKESDVKVSEKIELVSEEDISEVGVPEEMKPDVKTSKEDKSEARLPQEKKSEINVPQEKESEIKVSEEIESQIKVSEEEKSEPRLHLENESELKVPDVKVSEEIESQVKVSKEEISEVGEPAEKESEVRESKEEKSEVRLPREKESEVNVSEEMESEVKAFEENESQVNISKEVISEVRVPEEKESEVKIRKEDKYDVVLPQENESEVKVSKEGTSEVWAPEDKKLEIKVPQEKKSEVNVLVEIEFEVNVLKEKMSEVGLPVGKESEVRISEIEIEPEVKVSKEELSDVMVPEEKEAEVRVSEIELEYKVEVSKEEISEVRVPEEKEAEVKVCKAEKSEVKLPDEEDESEVRVSERKESEVKLLEEKECEAHVSEQDESEGKVSEVRINEENESEVKSSKEIESEVRVAKEIESEVTVLEENGSLVRVSEEKKTEIMESQELQSTVDEFKEEIKSEIRESEEPESEMKKSEEKEFEEKETEDWELVEKVSVVKELNTDKSATLDSKENKGEEMVSEEKESEVKPGEKRTETMESETKELEDWELVDNVSDQKEDQELVGSYETGSSVEISDGLVSTQVPSVDHIEIISISDNSHEFIVVSETELCQLTKVEQEPSNSSRETADEVIMEPADQMSRKPAEEVSREPVDQVIVEPVSVLVDNGSDLVSGLAECGEVTQGSIVRENVEQARMEKMTGSLEPVDRETTSREIELSVIPAKSIEPDDVGIVLDTSVEPDKDVVLDASREPEKSLATGVEPDKDIVLETSKEPDKNISLDTSMEPDKSMAPCTSMQLDENIVPYTGEEPDKSTLSYTSVEPADRQPADREPADREPADREPTDREPADREPADREPAHRELADREPTDREPADREPAEREPADREPSDREPADREPADREPAETHHTEQSDTTFSETSIAESSSSDARDDSSENGSTEFQSIESNNSSLTKRVVITESRVERRRGEQRGSSSLHASKEIDSGELEKVGPQTEGGDAEDGSAAVEKTIDSTNPTIEEAQAAADDDSQQIAVEHHNVVVRPDVLAACAVYAEYLRDPTVAVDSDNVVSCVDFLRVHWFELSGRKTSNANQVQIHLDEFQTFGTSLAQSLVNMADSDGNTAMHYAVSYGNTRYKLYFIKGNTAMHYAVSYGNMEVIDVLLNTGFCSVDKQNKAGYTSIMLASLLLVDLDQHESLVLRLFHSGDVNSTSATSGQTSLMLAASHGRSEMVALLLQSGAEINLQDEDGSTALMCASEHGHSDVIRTLLSHPDCDSTITDVDGSTALSVAMEEGHHDIGVFLYAHMKAIDDRLLEEPEED